MARSETKKFSVIEKGPGIKAGLKNLKSHLNGKTITAGIIAAIFGTTGPALVTIKAATDAGYTHPQMVSWLFGIYVFGGLVSLIMALKYKMPIVGAFSISGASMLGTALVGFTFNEASGAFIIAGVLVLILGLSGLVGKVMRWIPLPIVMGMIGGVMIKFGINIVNSVAAAPIVGAASLIGFLFVPKLIKKFPPVVAALIFGLVTAVITKQINLGTMEFSYIAPQLVKPSFNISTILSISIPLAVLIIGAESAQAVGVLYAQGYNPPVNAMTITSGIGSIIAGLFGAHGTNIAGPMTAICSSEEAGKKEDRYAASIVDGTLFIIFGLISSIAIAFITLFPSELINILAGLAMINVLINAFKEGFSSNKFKMGAFTALIIAMSNITILKIGSAFWALLGGILVSLITEKKDFNKQEK